MPALVLELVQMATNPAISPTMLLRNALVVARRLDAPELIGWINAELNGYGAEIELPSYRKIQGQLKAQNPYNGDIPLFMDSKWAAALKVVNVNQGIPELIQLSDSSKSPCQYFPPEIEKELMDGMDLPMRPFVSISYVQIHAIVEKVQSRILEWALDLESKGVLGEGLTFSLQEKQTVQSQHYHFGDVSSSQIQISSPHGSQTQSHGDASALLALIAVLQDTIASQSIPKELSAELQAEIDTLKAQSTSPKPKWRVIRETVLSIKSILENAAGGIAATQALPYIAALLPS